jgi:carboxylate-amine ligase
LNPYVLKANKWQAARYGLTGEFVDPLGKLSTQRLALTASIEKLMRYLEPTVKLLGTARYTDLIERVLVEGTGADSLRQRYIDYGGNFREVVQSLQGEFWQ